MKLAGVFTQIKNEIKEFASGKTIDALFPPIVYVIGNTLFGLKIGIILALSLALIVAIYRIYKKQTFIYAFGGVLGILIASGFAFFSDNASSYFLPKVISSGFLFLVSLISIIIGKPLAAVASHLSRGWKMDWFLRKDVKPAYREVTIVWTILFLLRMILQLILLEKGDLITLGWANILLGFPATISVLVLSFIYGVWRLKNLKGPGVDEFLVGKEPPWIGQTKGF